MPCFPSAIPPAMYCTPVEHVTVLVVDGEVSPHAGQQSMLPVYRTYRRPALLLQAWFGEAPVKVGDLVCGLCGRWLYLVTQVRGWYHHQVHSVQRWAGGSEVGGWFAHTHDLMICCHRFDAVSKSLLVYCGRLFRSTQHFPCTGVSTPRSSSLTPIDQQCPCVPTTASKPSV